MIYDFASGFEKYVFQTDLNWIYTVSIKNSHGYFIDYPALLNNGNVFEIIFERISIENENAINGNDHNVKDTILTIIINHLAENSVNHIYTFICFSRDRKELGRMLIFSRWYEAAKLPEWRMYAYQIGEDNAITYIGFFININHVSFSDVVITLQQMMENEKGDKDLFRTR